MVRMPRSVNERSLGVSKLTLLMLDRYVLYDSILFPYAIVFFDRLRAFLVHNHIELHNDRVANAIHCFGSMCFTSNASLRHPGVSEALSDFLFPEGGELQSCRCRGR